MDNSLFRTINRFADRTGWAHGAFKANAGYGSCCSPSCSSSPTSTDTTTPT